MNIPVFIAVCVVLYIIGSLLITVVQKLLSRRRANHVHNVYLSGHPDDVKDKD